MSSRRPLPEPLELWAGPEYTVNRVGDAYFDQVERSGHASRIEDLDLFAELGIRALRYPVLWERTAPEGVEKTDWRWPDERLARLRELGIRPIVGLLHHGSGPRHTSLVDPSFPEQLGEFAAAVATRYPWIEDYTPVNEPLTTARFSGLYGHWYPHGRDDATFVRALLTQCRAVVLAMRAIRGVTPNARLVQTDDLGRTFSTRTLAYQAEWENERRFVTFDLLAGRVDRDHPMWSFLRRGAYEDELAWFLSNPCPPDVLGVNHYLSSERFLDERLERYPEDSHGGNGRHRYADVLTARVALEGPAGPEKLLREAWERYGLPLAVTEAHNGCTREEQLRWVVEVWEGTERARREGADIRAVTLWSLLGAFDWGKLVTCGDGIYEPGVFDLRAPAPRPTALAAMARGLAAGRRFDHPVLATQGWWRRPERLFYPPVSLGPNARARLTEGVSETGGRARPILVTGARGTLGRAFARLCEARGLAHLLLTRQEMDIAEPASVERALGEHAPWAIVNAAGYVRVDEAEREQEACFRENAEGPAVLAEACARRGVALVTFSSDLVFDGRKNAPYVESDGAAPLSAYGRAKAEGEERVLAALPSALVVRTSAFFGPWDDYNFVTVALRELCAGSAFRAAGDAVVSPTYVPDLVHAALDLLIDGESGVWHLANAGAVTWADLVERAAALAGVPADALERAPTAELRLSAPRPLYSALGSERGLLLPKLDDALVRYVEERCSPLERLEEPAHPLERTL